MTQVIPNCTVHPRSPWRLRIAICCALLISFAGAAPGASLADEKGVVAAIRLLDLWIQEKVAYEAPPSLSIGIVYDQELVWAQGYGRADLESGAPATPDSRYRAGSVTKVFTATAVLQLRDQGRFSLDDPVETLLPGFSVQQPFEHTAQITVRHLLTHTSGLPREGAFPYWTSHVFPSRDELLVSVARQSLRSPPGETYRYSNLGLALLGALIEQVSGLDYADYMRENVFQPLGMSDSSIGIDPLDDQLATGYMRRTPDRVRRQHDAYPTGGLEPAAALVTTVGDLARFASLQFREGEAGGAQILRSSTVREMQRLHFVYPSFAGGMGLGFRVAPRDGKTAVSHGGWIGGHRAHLLMVPAEKIAVVAFTNADDASPYPFSRAAYDTVAPALLAAASATGAHEAEPGVQTPAEWQSYVGLYSDPWGSEYRVLILEGGLFMIGFDYPPADRPTDGLTRLEPAGNSEFRMSDGDPVIFEVDEHGKTFRIQRRYDFLFPLGADGLPQVTAEIPLPKTEDSRPGGASK